MSSMCWIFLFLKVWSMSWPTSSLALGAGRVFLAFGLARWHTTRAGNDTFFTFFLAFLLLEKRTDCMMSDVMEVTLAGNWGQDSNRRSAWAQQRAKPFASAFDALSMPHGNSTVGAPGIQMTSNDLQVSRTPNQRNNITKPWRGDLARTLNRQTASVRLPEILLQRPDMN